MVSQEPAKLSCVLSAVWVRVPVPPPEPSVGKFSKHRWHKMAIYVKARE